MSLSNEDLKAISTIVESIVQTTVQSQIEPLKEDITNIKLHLENVTDKNIQLLAENHVDLVNKLNQAIPVANKNIAFEVKINYLTEKVNKLEKEISDLKDKIA